VFYFSAGGKLTETDYNGKIYAKPTHHEKIDVNKL
jgi:hypothetical protein